MQLNLISVIDRIRSSQLEFQSKERNGGSNVSMKEAVQHNKITLSERQLLKVRRQAPELREQDR